jgi:hypothetical protein
MDGDTEKHLIAGFFMPSSLMDTTDGRLFFYYFLLSSAHQCKLSGLRFMTYGLDIRTSACDSWSRSRTLRILSKTMAREGGHGHTSYTLWRLRDLPLRHHHQLSVAFIHSVSRTLPSNPLELFLASPSLSFRLHAPTPIRLITHPRGIMRL